MSQDQQLRALIRSIVNEDARALVGDYLWPNHLLSNKYKTDAPTEVDTPREEDLRKKIFKFMKNNKIKTLGPSEMDDLLTIASDPRYKGVLSLYKRGKAYRGVSVSAGWFERNFGMSYDQLADQTPPGEDMFDVMKVIDRKYTLRPTGPMSSWSKSFDEAVTFATGMGFTGAEFSVPIVYEADAAENTFIDLKGVYDLYDHLLDLKDRRREKEVLLIGPAKCDRAHIIGWKHREPGKHYINVTRERGTGYDDVGTPTPWDPVNKIEVKRKYIDREFDALNIPDIDA
jgi:hypothetical protein